MGGERRLNTRVLANDDDEAAATASASARISAATRSPWATRYARSTTEA